MLPTMPGQLGGKHFRPLGTVYSKNGYRIQFRRRPPPFLGVHMTVVKKPSPGTDFIRRNYDPFKKEGNFSAKAQQTAHWVLFELFPRAQKRWWSPTRLRPEMFKYIHKSTAVQDADHCTNLGGYRSKRMVHNNRSQRRVFSCTHSSRSQKVPSFCLSKPGISVRGR